jgi:hypothetical protein
MDRPFRHLNVDERRLLMLLLSSQPDGARLCAHVEGLRVREMDDGGMGSLRFQASDDEHRRRSRTFASAQFKDTDGIPVLVALDVDQKDALFELDIWKVDFSPLQRIPETSKIHIE